MVVLVMLLAVVMVMLLAVVLLLAVVVMAILLVFCMQLNDTDYTFVAFKQILLSHYVQDDYLHCLRVKTKYETIKYCLNVQSYAHNVNSVHASTWF